MKNSSFFLKNIFMTGQNQTRNDGKCYVLRIIRLIAKLSMLAKYTDEITGNEKHSTERNLSMG